ncbi:MAG: S-layer homology domain-containing protein, partial [Clostridiales bacterium]|nr:S-layer homology domain-containing protein [Clostridiales bacterium]
MNVRARFLSLLMVAALALTMSLPALAAVEDTGFSDVTADAWYADAVEYVRDNGLMSGASTTAFSPNTTMTRAMLATVLYRLAGSPTVSGSDSFTDTTDGAWYAAAVLWASQQGLVTGYGNGLFGVNDPVSREQISTILWRYAGSPTADGGTDFADESSIASYASAAVDWARANGIINGMSGNLFAPKSSATRAQVAMILSNYVQNNTQLEPAPDLTPDPVPVDETNILVAYFTVPETSGTDAVALASRVVEDGEVVGNV